MWSMKFDLGLKENGISLIIKFDCQSGSPEDVLIERMVRQSKKDVEGRLASKGGDE